MEIGILFNYLLTAYFVTAALMIGLEIVRAAFNL